MENERKSCKLLQCEFERIIMEEMDLGKPRKRQSIGYLAQRILDRLPDHPKDDERLEWPHLSS
jgi:hypothetical protein